MHELVSFPVYTEALNEYANMEALSQSIRLLGCDGVEAIWGGDETWKLLPPGLALGYHLVFYPDWLDFWRGDEKALLQKFGNREDYASFYGGDDREALLRQYRDDLARAEALHVNYAVYHVSDVSVEEGYTYRWLHSDEDVIDAAAALINEVVGKCEPPFPILVENQWWPGFTFSNPKLTERLLSALHFENKGILLDTGHLMNTNATLRTQREGAEYIIKMLEEHGSLSKYVKAVHLHQSLSGEYVLANTGFLPEHLAADYLTRFGDSYGHILKIDQHMPWTDPSVREVVERINPEFLTHELSSRTRKAREAAISVQRAAIYGKA